MLLDEAVDGGLQVNERMEDAALEAPLCESGRGSGTLAATPPTPPNVRFSVFGGWTGQIHDGFAQSSDGIHMP